MKLKNTFMMSFLMSQVAANFYLEQQFAPFEKTGFTEQMILGAKQIYFDASFYADFEMAEM